MKTVLLADDNAGLREAVAKHLHEAGYRVLEAAGGDEALAVLARDRVDALVSDLKMPGLGGMELLRRARQERPEMPVLMMTAFGRVEDAVEAMRLGALDFLVKPFGMEELVVKLDKAMRSAALEGQNQALREELVLYRGAMVGESPAMRAVYQAVRQAAQALATVLLTGESGTGKELAARAIHESGLTRDKPFVRVHCAALAPGVLESELFGHEKGAFTGAVGRKPGRFELADQGTLFLDEISEVPPETQVKLLRVLQEREFERVGGTLTLKVDLRIIASSNRDLKGLVEDGRFREDLFYRLNVIHLRMPPLRERGEDALLLARNFLEQFEKQAGKGPCRLSEKSLQALGRHSWPGNVRELRNLMERAVVFAPPGPVELDVQPEPSAVVGGPGWDWKGNLSSTLDAVEKSILVQALKDCNGVQNQAARKMGLSRAALQYKVKKHHLEGNCHE